MDEALASNQATLPDVEPDFIAAVAAPGGDGGIAQEGGRDAERVPDADGPIGAALSPHPEVGGNRTERLRNPDVGGGRRQDEEPIRGRRRNASST